MRFDEYFELSEEKGWRVTDFDWDGLRTDARTGQLSQFDRDAIVGTAVIEHGVPHYGDVWQKVNGLRDEWELWQFTTLWTGEEHRHSYALKKTADIVGIGDAVNVDLEVLKKFPFADKQKASCDADCYTSVPGMLTYAVIQELATAKFYTMAAKRATSPTLRRLFNLIGNDEMRHHVFYRDALQEIWTRSPDQAWYCDQVFHATRAFHMPHLIYGLQKPFFDGGDWDIMRDLVPQLARCFAFDPPLLMRLAAVRMAALAGDPLKVKAAPDLVESAPVAGSADN